MNNWSGTPFHMINVFEQQGIEIEHIGNLKRRVAANFKLKQLKKLVQDQRESINGMTFALNAPVAIYCN